MPTAIPAAAARRRAQRPAGGPCGAAGVGTAGGWRRGGGGGNGARSVPRRCHRRGGAGARETQYLALLGAGTDCVFVLYARSILLRVWKLRVGSGGWVTEMQASAPPTSQHLAVGTHVLLSSSFSVPGKVC